MLTPRSFQQASGTGASGEIRSMRACPTAVAEWIDLSRIGKHLKGEHSERCIRRQAETKQISANVLRAIGPSP
jgi:hypothetical protein